MHFYCKENPPKTEEKKPIEKTKENAKVQTPKIEGISTF